MKKYLIQISGLGNLEFNLPVLKGKKLEVLSKVLLSLGVIAFFLLIIVLPYSNLFTGKTLEQSSFELLIVFTCSMVGFLCSYLLLQGKKVLVDPKYFLSVLLFALLTTAASVLKTPPHISNTFGIENVRSLSGITIMALVGFYFLFNLVAKDFKMLDRITNAVKFSFIVLIVILIFHTNISDLNFVNANLAIVMFAYFYLTLSLVFSRSKRTLKSILLAVSAIFVFLTPQTLPNSLISTQIITSALLSIAVLAIIYGALKRDFLSKKLNELNSYREGFKDKRYSLSEVSYFLLLSVSIIAIVVGVLVHFRFNFSFDLLLNPLNTFINEIKSTFAGNFNLQAFFVGSGSYDSVLKVTNLNTAISSISNVFVTQGLVGTLAYIFILITSLTALFKAIKRSLTIRSKRGFIFVTSFSLIFIAIYSFLVYGGELFTIYFWVAFASIAVFLNIKDLNEIFVQKDWEVGKIFTNNKWGIFLRALLAILLFIVSALALISFTRITV